tara:strand:- start:1417 stop:2400 length:984 start_codon:yes stop_codon:yes gene_type:complete
MTYGSDVSAPAVAYVCDKLNLPGPAQSTVETLVNKNKFRQVINQSINYKEFTIFSEALDYCRQRSKPFVIKPIDSAGSKGITFIEKYEGIPEAINYAFVNSISKVIIVEDYIEKKGKQVCGDGFMFDGKLKFIFFGDGHFYDDKNYLAPWGETFPSTSDPNILVESEKVIENILNKCGYHSGPFNVDLFIDSNNKPFVNEIGPRNGGNFIPQVTKLATGVDMIAASVEYCYNKTFEFKPTSTPDKRYVYSSYMIHSKEDLNISGWDYKQKLKRHIIKETLFSDYISSVSKFNNGSKALGNLMLRFESIAEMNELYKEINKQVVWSIT